MTKIAILTNGPRPWASSRLRGFWMEDHDPVHIKVYGPGDPLAGIEECDAVVFQKRQDGVALERARRYRTEGKIVLYDMTEPMWWWYPNEVGDMFKAAHVVTASSPALAEAVRASGIVKQAVCIPDRVLPSYHPTWKQHAQGETIKLAWYGSSSNRIALEGFLPTLGYIAHNRKLELRVIDDTPGVRVAETDMGHLKIRTIPWTLETFHAQLMDCDMAYLPPYPGPWGLLKSNNRQVTAWWAGLPVVDGFRVDEMMRFIDSAEERQAVAAENRAIAERDWDIGQSVQELVALVGGLQGARTVKVGDLPGGIEQVSILGNGAKDKAHDPV